MVAGQRRHPVKDGTRSKLAPGQRRFNCYNLMRHSQLHNLRAIKLDVALQMLAALYYGVSLSLGVN